MGMAVSSDQEMPWSTLNVVGFERVTQLYIASSASVDLDDIVLARWEPAPGVPGPEAEPGEHGRGDRPRSGVGDPRRRRRGDRASSGTTGANRQP